MRKELEEKYAARLKEGKDAVSLIHDGDVVFVGSLSSVAAGLMDAIADRIDEGLKDITIAEAFINVPSRLFDDEHGGKIKVSSYFMGPYTRKLASFSDG